MLCKPLKGNHMKLTKAIKGCTAGAVHATVFAAGSECPDDLLAAALDAGALSKEDAEKASKIVQKAVSAAAEPVVEAEAVSDEADKK
jgi:hypothetical protein